MSILFHLPDNVGLGHLSRCLAIAGAVQERATALPILFLAELADTRLLRASPFPFYSLPSPYAFAVDKRWAYTREQAHSIWPALVKQILASHRPRLVVHDTGIRPDIYALAEAQGCRQVLIVRNRPDLFRYFAHQRRWIEPMSLIAFAHHQDEIPPLEFSWLDQSRLMFCGPLPRRSRRDIDPATARAAYGIRPDLLTLVISNGGGNTAEGHAIDPFPEIVFSALQALEPEMPPFRVIFITGPFPSSLPAFPETRSGSVLIREFDPNLIDLFAAADLVIARGGYNSVLELEQIGVPAICSPASRGLDDQDGRIRQAESRSKNIHYVPLNVDALQLTIRDILTGPRWVYQPSSEPDPIARNKQMLADRLLALL